MKIRVILSVLLLGQGLVFSQNVSEIHGNPARTGYTDASVPTHPRLLWTYHEKHPPRPAWREPNREIQYIDFDYATQPAIGGGMVFFGSSADHIVHALDISTGQEVWKFYTEGPVRFAPVLGYGRAYVTSDDGNLYCLDARTGRLIWKFRGGPANRKVMGNDQMISLWPARSGALLVDGKLYFTAGMWSREGVFIYCLNPADGSVFWKNETAGFHFTTLPHASGFAGVAPQGNLVLHRNRLYVPCGRGAPAAFDATNGKFLFYENGLGYKPHQPGGSRVMAYKDWVIFKRRSQHKEESVRYEPRDPAKGAALGLFAISWDTGEIAWSLTDRNIAAAKGDKLILAGQGAVIRTDINRLMKGYEQFWKDGKYLGYDENIEASGVEYTTSAKGKLIPKPAWMSPLPYKEWEADVGRIFTLLCAKNTILAGGRGQVSAIDFNTGKILWQHDVDGEARHIIAAGGRFIVSTTAGKIYCFGNGKVAGDIRTKTLPPQVGAEARARAAKILKQSGLRAGYCLLLGAGDGQLIAALAQQSDLIIQCLEPDGARISRVRKMLDEAGLLGVRAVVHQGTFKSVSFNPYIFNLIVVHNFPDVNRQKIYRVLRPYGGIALIPGDTDTEAWIKAGVPREEIVQNAGGLLIRRGKLPGAGEWTHPYADVGRSSSSEDQLVKLPLGMLWWGGPGPARMVSRHWYAPVPVFANGTLYIQGQHDIIAVDAYNGREIWNRHLENVGRYPPMKRGGNIVADEESVFCIQTNKCLRLAAATGKTMAEYTFPVTAEIAADLKEMLSHYTQKPYFSHIVWEYLGLSGRYLIGTLGNEVEMNAKRHAFAPYFDAPQQSKYLFIFDKNSGRLLWRRRMNRALSPMAIVADEKKIYFLDRTDERLYLQYKRRGGKGFSSTLIAADLATGKTVWQKENIPMHRKALILKHDVLVAFPNPAENVQSEGDKGLGVYSAVDGHLLWEQGTIDKIAYDTRGSIKRHTFVVGDTLFTPWAYDLKTGKEKLLRKNPLTGKAERFDVFGKSFCGTIAAGADILAYRAASIGFQELSRDSGCYWLPEVRPSCWISVIPAGGLMLAPEGASTCICPYNYKTSLALYPVERNEDWSVYLSAGQKQLKERRAAAKANRGKSHKKKKKTASKIIFAEPVKTMRLNLNAAGDRMSKGDFLWLAWPRQTDKPYPHYEPMPLPVTRTGSDTGFRRNADLHPVKGTQSPWLFNSGITGAGKLIMELGGGKPRVCRLRLYFMEPEYTRPGQRIFSIKVNGREIVSNLDVFAKAGGKDRALIITKQGIPVSKTLELELVPVRGEPLLCAVAVVVKK